MPHDDHASAPLTTLMHDGASEQSTPKRRGSALARSERARATGLFLLVSAACGLLVAALAMPGVMTAGAATKAGQDSLGSLPLAFDPPAQSQRTTVLDTNGDPLAYFFEENRTYVPLDDIAPVMKQAQISIEDHRFYEHGPLDVQGTLRALLTNIAAGGVAQGGSTITQQYVKMVQIEAAKQAGDQAGVEAAQEGSYGRKIKELRYAISVEKNLTKDQILERYLNIAYFGDGAYGVEAAAEHYFGTTAKKLTLPQAALLAGLVQNPTAFNPVQNPGQALERRNVVLNRMAQLGVISADQLAKAKKTGFSTKRVETFRSGCQNADYPFVCDYILRTLKQTPSLGATVAEREQAVMRGGLTIRTAFDPKTQDVIQKRVSRVVGATDPVISVMDMIEPGTGRILAMAQSRPVMGADAKAGETYWNYSVGPEMGGAQGFQAGSTFKAFTAAAALEEGMPLSTRYDARERMDFTGASFESCSGATQVGGQWIVGNSTGTNGVMDMYLAAQRSVNTYFVQLALDVGMCKVTKMAEKLGIESSTPDAPVSSYDDKPSFTLGTLEVSPLSVAEAYATFASGGIHCDPVIIDSIRKPAGEKLEVPSANCDRVISSDVAAAMNSLLGSVMTKGTGQRVATYDRRPQAGKTGTINSNAAVWFAGYTPQVAGVAMISIDIQERPFDRSKSGYRYSGLKNYRIPSTDVPLEGSGSGDAGQEIWKPAMETYLRGEPVEQFDTPPASLVTGRTYGWGYGQGQGQGQYGNQIPSGPGANRGPR